MIIYERTNALCEENNISVNKFEQESGVGRNSLARWNKSAPSIDKVMKAALYFNVSVDYLCGLTDIKTPADILSGLTDDDIELIKKFNSASAGRREAILELLKSPAPSHEAQGGGADLQ